MPLSSAIFDLAVPLPAFAGATHASPPGVCGLDFNAPPASRTEMLPFTASMRAHWRLAPRPFDFSDWLFDFSKPPAASKSSVIRVRGSTNLGGRVIRAEVAVSEVTVMRM
jgi:hypothetical protein